MAKGGKKGPKRYELPDEKFIVVVNPWGSPTNKLFINNVGAWFEHMLYEDYPNTQVEAIYTQAQQHCRGAPCPCRHFPVPWCTRVRPLPRAALEHLASHGIYV
ncbi:hypothetical protein BD779DRAFT_279619 [Infundibulicybe gibba]|nr:hypothetical protein BD779DRAFT_279619 [Infundibulicybe gibba]